MGARTRAAPQSKEAGDGIHDEGAQPVRGRDDIEDVMFMRDGVIHFVKPHSS